VKTRVLDSEDESPNPDIDVETLSAGNLQLPLAALFKV